MCGGLIHPIAGKCKHCKGDLSALRSNRPAAAASLPALHAHGNVQMINARPGSHLNGYHPPAPAPHGPTPHTNGHANYVPVPQAAAHVAMMPVHDPVLRGQLDGTQPILPPRPTGRMYAAQTPRASWWKSWPLIVIVLAMLAIVTAVILMVWPPGGPTDQGVKNGKLSPPAPERMDTNPLVPHSPPARSGDPWSAPKPADPPRPDITPDIDIPDDPDVDDPLDPTGSGSFGSLSGSGAIMMSMMRHACDRAASCGQLDSMLKDYCDMTKKLPNPPAPASCPSAARCLQHIDQMSCSGGFDDINALSSVMYKFQDCVEAISC